VETVKGFAKQEREIMEAMANARAGLLNARAGLRLHRTDAEALSALRSTGDESADLAAALI